MNLALQTTGRELGVSKGSYVTFLYNALGGYKVCYDGQEGLFADTQFMRGWSDALTEMKDMSHLKKGKLYRYGASGWLFKEADQEHSIGQVLKDSVVMFIEQSSRKAYVYKVVCNDQVGWLSGLPELFKELINDETDEADEAEETGEREAVPDQAGSGSHEASLQGWGQDC